MKKIVVLGSTNTDMVIAGKKIPVPGETISGGTFLMNPGGKGANQAVAVARLSAKRIRRGQALRTLFRRSGGAYRQDEASCPRRLGDVSDRLRGQARHIALCLWTNDGRDALCRVRIRRRQAPRTLFRRSGGAYRQTRATSPLWK